MSTQNQNSCFTFEQICQVTGVPPAAVEENWPVVLTALNELLIASCATQIAAIATIAVEVPSFRAIDEYGDTAYFTRMYEGRKDLGNTNSGDGNLYHGRGFIQLSGRANYVTYGDLLQLPLVSEPHRALETEIAAQIFAMYFSQRGIPLLAEQRQWKSVRVAVNGGLNGWARFSDVVEQLEALLTRSS